mgnify:CR=1 FL=1
MDEGLLARHLAEADLLVNTTSLGMSPNVDASPLPEGITPRPECGVADMIYSPPKTKLIRTAEGRGCKTTSGHLMLLHQAVEAFKFWTGVDPDVSAMDAALRADMHELLRELRAILEPTVVLVTHAPFAAAALAETIAVLSAARRVLPDRAQVAYPRTAPATVARRP